MESRLILNLLLSFGSLWGITNRCLLDLSVHRVAIKWSEGPWWPQLLIGTCLSFCNHFRYFLLKSPVCLTSCWLARCPLRPQRWKLEHRSSTRGVTHPLWPDRQRQPTEWEVHNGSSCPLAEKTQSLHLLFCWIFKFIGLQICHHESWVWFLNFSS